MSAEGLHGLSCAFGPGRASRHACLNDLIHKGLIRAGYPTIKEPVGLLRSDGKRPDGLTLIPWQGGRSLVWDATVTNTVATSYAMASSTTAGAAAEMAATRKHSKYVALSVTHDFIPLAFETLGPINEEGLAFIKTLGKRIKDVTGDSRETAFLFQRLSITIQRYNAVAFRGTFAELECEEGRCMLH